MAKYAQATTVSSQRSREELERILARYGATAFAYAWEGTLAVVAFKLHGRQYRLTLPLPDRYDPAIRYTATRKTLRSPTAQAEAFEQQVRQRWRALVLVVKAKLEAVEAGILTVESAFVAETVLPNGQTVGQWLPQPLEAALMTGQPPMLPWATTGEPGQGAREDARPS
jgi:hypothetical protein